MGDELRDERHLQRGAAHLLYRLAHALVADYMPVAVDGRRQVWPGQGKLGLQLHAA